MQFGTFRPPRLKSGVLHHPDSTARLLRLSVGVGRIIVRVVGKSAFVSLLQRKGFEMAQKRQLCSGQYRAFQVLDDIFIIASGVHPTSGFDVTLAASPLDIFPPQFVLWHTPPKIPTLDVLTPFAVSSRFESGKSVNFVTVVDSYGKNRVPVEQTPDLLDHVERSLETAASSDSAVDVGAEVKKLIANRAQVNISKVTEETELSKLDMNSLQMRFLAIDLTKFIRNHGGSKELLSGDIGDLTVKGVIDLVKESIA